MYYLFHLYSPANDANYVKDAYVFNGLIVSKKQRYPILLSQKLEIKLWKYFACSFGRQLI